LLLVFLGQGLFGLDLGIVVLLSLSLSSSPVSPFLSAWIRVTATVKARVRLRAGLGLGSGSGSGSGSGLGSFFSPHILRHISFPFVLTDPINVPALLVPETLFV
jgi:hypothetical protein